jgi:hypothetical protein
MNQQHLKWLIAATISVVVLLQWMGWSADQEPYVGDFEGFTVQAPAQEEATTHTITFDNQCHESIWVGSVGNSGHSALNGGGWVMEATTTMAVEAPVGWSGRFWPRTGCAFGSNGLCPTEGVKCCASGSCLTSDNKTFGLECASSGTPPASLMEVTFDAPSGNGPYDTYDISFVDGWSVPVRMTAVTGTFNPDPDPGIEAPWCRVSGCTAEPACPDEFKVEGSPRSCWSPCQHSALLGDASAKLCCACTMEPTPPGQPALTCPDAGCQYGCTPYHDPAYPEDMTCNPWDTNTERAWDATSLSYIAAVKAVCPEVYAWQFDDHAATFNCRKTDGLVDYTVTFCP